jgi:hypothetical protein
MPRIGTSTPRSALQTSTSTTPATATPAILTIVKPTGGVTRPRTRRRAARRHVVSP